MAREQPMAQSERVASAFGQVSAFLLKRGGSAYNAECRARAAGEGRTRGIAAPRGGARRPKEAEATTRRCSSPLRAIQHEGPEIQKGRSVSGAIGLIGVSGPARKRNSDEWNPSANAPGFGCPAPGRRGACAGCFPHAKFAKSAKAGSRNSFADVAAFA